MRIISYTTSSLFLIFKVNDLRNNYCNVARTCSRMDDSKCKQRVAIDMQFESLMRPKDIRHLFVQLAHAYAVNRRAANPLQFSVVGFSGPQNKVFSPF